MTTVVADWQTRTLYADSKTSDGEVKWKAQKLERIGGSIFGAAGSCSSIEAFLKWKRTGGTSRKPRLAGSFVALEIDAEGVWLWDATLQPFPPGRETFAIGSGAAAALAALEMGASPQKAVEIACLVDDCSEGPITSLSL